MRNRRSDDYFSISGQVIGGHREECRETLQEMQCQGMFNNSAFPFGLRSSQFSFEDLYHDSSTGWTLINENTIGLYRDVWIAAIASSRASLVTLTGVMCNTSQCELRSLRVNSGMLNVIRIVTFYALPRQTRSGWQWRFRDKGLY